jgi:hypothetical protein
VIPGSVKKSPVIIVAVGNTTAALDRVDVKMCTVPAVTRNESK